MIRKSSKQRDMMLNCMKRIDGHVTPEQVFRGINAGGQRVSLIAIYRNLNILCEMHEVKKIVHPIDGYQYDRTCKPYYHLRCIKCDRTFDLNIPYLGSLNKEVSKQTGLPVKAHNMIAEGICQDCLKKQNDMGQKH